MIVYTHPKYKYVRVAEIPKSEIEKIDFATCNQPGESVRNFYNRQQKKPALVTNGGFFGMANGHPCFNFIDEKTSMNACEQYAWGMGIIGDDKLMFGVRGNNTQSSWRDFISGFPCLLSAGHKEAEAKWIGQEINYKARRTLLGYNDTTVFLVVVESPGMKFDACQNLLLGLGVTYAINLDGGGSSKMIAYGNVVTTDWTERAVDNVVAIYLKDEFPEVKPIEPGCTVKVLKNIIYDSKKTFRTWFDTYTVYSVCGDRAVIGVDGVITAPVHIDNLRRVD